MLIRHAKSGDTKTKLQRPMPHNDLHSLMARQYALETLNGLLPFERDIPPALRAEALELSKFGCYMCGMEPGDTDPYDSSRKVRLHVDCILPISQGGLYDTDNLRVICSTCNQGRRNVQQPSESALNILGRLRHAPRSVQKEVYEALKKTFGDA